MITIKNVTLRRSAKVLLEGATVTLNPGEKVGLVGRNGAGKSSLFALLNGNLHEDAGEFYIPTQWRMGQVAQDMPETEQSATEFVIEGDTVLNDARAEVKAAEATDDYERMANAYMARSVWILAKAEKQLGNASEAAALETRFETLKSAIWAELGEAAAKTPTGAATLLEFDLAPADKRAEIADNLAAGVRDTDGLIVTGFLGTPIILDAMSRNGQLDAAFTMLLREEIRSWLYPIKMGATTIWERWDGIAEDGSISGGELASAAEGSEGSMISFNHYAYGAVVDWIYRNVGGIAPQAAAYEQILIAPRPHEKITSSDTSIDTGYGRISLNWEIRDSNLVGELTVPFGVTASFDLLGSANSALIVNSRSVEKGQTFGHGRYTFLLNNPLIAH